MNLLEYLVDKLEGKKERIKGNHYRIVPRDKNWREIFPKIVFGDKVIDRSCVKLYFKLSKNFYVDLERILDNLTFGEDFVLKVGLDSITRRKYDICIYLRPKIAYNLPINSLESLKEVHFEKTIYHRVIKIKREDLLSLRDFIYEISRESLYNLEDKQLIKTLLMEIAPCLKIIEQNGVYYVILEKHVILKQGDKEYSVTHFMDWAYERLSVKKKFGNVVLFYFPSNLILDLIKF